MKPIEPIDWSWMKRNLHEQGFEKLVEKINEVIERVNQIEQPPEEANHIEQFEP